MSGILQKFGFRKSPYSRPTQPWVCGNKAKGFECHVGPDRQGRCSKSSQCNPRKEGDRWVCTRSQLAGGSCQQGPSPDGSCCRPIPVCQPVRSISAKRGMLVRWVSSVTVALVLIGLTIAGGVWFANPGDLTNQHADIGDCGTCHSTFNSGVLGWVHSAFKTSTASNDSERCVNCHQLGENSMQAHSMVPAQLTALTQTTQTATESGGALLIKTGIAVFGRSHLSNDIVCIACHREHQGAEEDLTLMDNQNCMSCHTAQFKSFSNGHPEFLEYPYAQQTRLAFDHVNHIGKHFQDDDYSELAPAGCKDCHMPDSLGRTMLVNGFEQACSACHLNQIYGQGRATSKGIVTIAVPGIDRETLYDQGISLGEWPEFSEEPLSPFVEILMSTDAEFTAAYSALKDEDLMNLTDADEQTLELVAEVTWRFKLLMLDLVTQGAQAIEQRLESVLDRPLNSQEAADLLAMLPMDLIISAQNTWFPNLLQEVALYQSGEQVPNPDMDELGEQSALTTMTESVITTQQQSDDSELDDLDVDNLFADDGADNDLFVDELLSQSSGSDTTDPDGLIDADAEDDDLFADDGMESDPDDLFADDGLESDPDDLFADDGLESDPDDLFADDGLESDPDDLFAADQTDVDDQLNESQQDEATLEDEFELVSAEDWMKFGGWYLDDLVIRYRPSGHSDRFMYHWIEMMSKQENPLSLRIFESLTSENAPGKCADCHSIEKSSKNQNKVAMNWAAKRPDPLLHTFTKFSHTSHFSLLDEDGCFKCHQIDKQSDFMSGFSDQDPTTFASNFKPMEKAVCSECHQSNKAGDDCLSCHSYHIGVFQSTDLVDFEMSIEKEPDVENNDN